MFEKVQYCNNPHEAIHYLQKDRVNIIFLTQEFLLQECSTISDEFDFYTILIPGVIWEKEVRESGALICALKPDAKIQFFDDEYPIDEHYEPSECNSFLVFLDGFNKASHEALEQLYESSHVRAKIFGAGVGTSEIENRYAITHKMQVKSNGILTIMAQLPVSLGVQHGFSLSSGYFVAKGKGNTITSINSQNPFEFYQNYLRKHFDITLDATNVFEIGIQYPFGIGSTTDVQTLRTPVTTNEKGEIILAGPVDENTTLCILETTQEDIQKGSQCALEKALKNKNGYTTCFLISCVGRRLYFGDDYNANIKKLYEKLEDMQTVFGILSMGEIANNADRYVEYYNETCIVGLLP